MNGDGLRRLYKLNAEDWFKMIAKAERTGKAVNGYTIPYMSKCAELCARLSTATDAELQAHLDASRKDIEARLAWYRR